MVRDKLTKQGIADAVIKVEDHDHDIRSGQPLKFIYLLAPLSNAQRVNAYAFLVGVVGNFEFEFLAASVFLHLHLWFLFR